MQTDRGQPCLFGKLNECMPSSGTLHMQMGAPYFAQRNDHPKPRTMLSSLCVLDRLQGSDVHHVTSF